MACARFWSAADFGLNFKPSTTLSIGLCYHIKVRALVHQPSDLWKLGPDLYSIGCTVTYGLCTGTVLSSLTMAYGYVRFCTVASVWGNYVYLCAQII